MKSYSFFDVYTRQVTVDLGFLSKGMKMVKQNVLVVDDAGFVREMVSKTLRTRFPDMQVEDAINGRQAQQMMQKSDFDLVLCDWEMPEMSGIELLSWIRQEKKSKVPFVMVTSRGDKADLVEALQAGATDYMGKPFSNENLIAKVVKVLGKQQHSADRRGAPKSGRVGDGSINALSAKRQPQKTPSKPITAKANQQPKPLQSKGTACLRFADHISPCQIKALSLKQIVLIGNVSDSLPTILQSIVVDLEQNPAAANENARINAYVHSLQANEHNIDCKEVTVTVNISDQDPNKLTYLSRVIASGTTQTGYIPGA